jgi:hypothetical protein
MPPFTELRMILYELHFAKTFLEFYDSVEKYHDHETTDSAGRRDRQTFGSGNEEIDGDARFIDYRLEMSGVQSHSKGPRGVRPRKDPPEYDI